MLNIDKEVSKIEYFKTFFIVNNNYLVLNKDFSLNEVYYEMCNKILDEVKVDDNYLNNFYQSIADKMDNTYKYYFELQDKIEDMLYPNNDYYNLIINISKIYHLIDLGRFFLDIWKDSCKGLIRRTYVVDLISDYYDLNKIKKEYYIYKLVKLYNEECDASFLNTIKMYDYEKYLFLSLISIPKIIDENNIKYSINVLNYVNYTYTLLLEEYEKYQKDSHSKFEEQNNNV